MALAIAFTAGAAAASTLVVKSSGPSARSYPPGKAIPDTTRIVLKANDQVVILDGRGTRTLKGPGTFSPTVATERATDTRSTFASLVSQRRARTGAVRSVTGTPARPVAEPARSPNIWFVDAERSSNICVTDPSRVTLWRPEGSPGLTATLWDATGKKETLTWNKGQSQMPWPATMAVSDGAKFKLTWQGESMPVDLTFSVLGPNPTGLEDMASALIRNGCEAQLDLLIETVAIPEPAGSPAG